MAITHIAIGICEWCNCLFVPRRYAQKFCSNICQYTCTNKRNSIARSLKPRRVSKCLRCGKGLEGKSRKAIYCSKTCKSMDYMFHHRGSSKWRNRARRIQIIERDGARCYMCKTALQYEEIELDHLIPVSKGGSSDAMNVAVSCMPCNRSRGNKIGMAQWQKLSELGVAA